MMLNKKLKHLTRLNSTYNCMLTNMAKVLTNWVTSEIAEYSTQMPLQRHITLSI